MSPLARACGPYGMELLLETRLDAFPAHDDAFLVVDSLLSVRIVSPQAAKVLGVNEEDLIDRPVEQFLGPADAEGGADDDFLCLLHRASTDLDERQSVYVRPRNAFGVRMVARVGPCGPPRAALVLLRSRAPQIELCMGEEELEIHPRSR